MFAGDKEYKSNFALEFASSFTFDRFKQEKFQRHLFPIKGYICASALLWMVLYHSAGVAGFFGMHFGLVLHIAAFYFARVKYSPAYVRLCFIFMEYVLQAASFSYCANYSLALHLVLFNLPTFILNLLLVYVWYYHLGISLGLTLLRYFLLPSQRFSHTFYEFLAISVLTSAFAFVERNMKEDWVLFDSFRRAQKIYMKLIDQTPIPTFVMDSLGHVIYCNKSGQDLYNSAKGAVNEQRNWSFLDLVYADQRRTIEDIIKRATKKPVDPIEVPILTQAPAPEEDRANLSPKVERKPSKVQLGLDLLIVNQGVGYKYYKLKMERVAWKAANCVMLSCEYTMEYKESFNTLLHNSLQLRERLSSTSDELEKVVIRYKKDKDVKALLDAKETYYLNEHSVLYAMQSLNNMKLENESYNIKDTLGYLLELLSFKAHPHKILLVLGREACFPKEVTGDKVKFEMLMIEMLVYLIEHANEGEIKVLANMKCPDAMGFVLSFEILAKKNEHINRNELEKTFVAKEPPQKLYRTHGLHISNCRTLLQLLKGTIEIIDHDPSTVKLSIELPFANRDPSKEVASVPKLGIYETEKINEYTIRWLSKRITLPSNVADSVRPIEYPAIPMSPAPRPTERFSLRNVKGTPGSRKTLISEDLVKKKMIERITKKSGGADTPQPGSSAIMSEESKGENSGQNSVDDLRKKTSDPSAEVNGNGKAELTPPSANKHEVSKKSGFYRDPTAPVTEFPVEAAMARVGEKEKAVPDQKEKGIKAGIKTAFEQGEIVNEKVVPPVEEEKKRSVLDIKKEVEEIMNDQDYDVGEDIQDGVNRIPSIETPISIKSKGSPRAGNECHRRVDSKGPYTPSISPGHPFPCILQTSKQLAAKREERKVKPSQIQKSHTANYQSKINKMRTRKKWQKVLISPEEKPEDIKRKTPKVLIVEDNQFVVLPIQTTLKRNRIEYDLAKNGLMAVDRYNQAMKESYAFNEINDLGKFIV